MNGFYIFNHFLCHLSVLNIYHILYFVHFHFLYLCSTEKHVVLNYKHYLNAFNIVFC